ncbi:MATE family efflux transporter [Solimonas marina]|uniref:Multidrug-efflux transporter n=1 Tax=Solimonas marina TaxID=2714601 RepID=A0A969W8T2_9GAMM|nr:MATE family efflux transporter [Solimonas marina]NKF21634.1 MATE family efflux transporter [Solimonas marina]
MSYYDFPAIRAEVRAYLRLAWPIVIAQLSFVSMGTVDTILAGRLGAPQLAAIAVGANVFFLLFVFFSGLFMAVSPLVAQALGAQRGPDEISRLLRGALVLAVCCGLLWSAVILLVRVPVLDILGVGAETRAYASGYLIAIALAPVPICINFVQRYAADAHGMTRLSLVSALVGFVVNGVAGYALMYGRLGMPALGPQGAGYALALADTTMVFVYAAQYRRAPALRALQVLRAGPWPWREPARQVLRLGLPIAAIVSAEASLFQIGALFVAHFGADTMAAHQIAINWASIMFMIPLSIGMAATVRIGHAAGAGDAAAVALRGRVGILIAVGFALCSAGAMLLMPRTIVALYTNVDAVAHIAVGFLSYAALFQIIDCIQATSNGALRGLKDTRVPMIITVTAYWIVGLPLAAWLTFRTSLGPAGVWCGFIGGLAVAAIGLGARFLRQTARTTVALEAR